MPSKTSKKPRRTPGSPWKFEPSCSEVALARLAGELARQLRSGDIVLLEGPMGAGKSTFARAVLESLKVDRPPEGSPTFSIAHEYRSAAGQEVVHLDLYRLKSEAEVEAAGVHAYFWERGAVVLCEWASMFVELDAAIRRHSGARVWDVRITPGSNELTREVTITRL